MEEFSGKNQENDQQAEKRSDRKRNRQKKKKGNSKVDSNDSLGSPDRGGDIRHPRPPFGVESGGKGKQILTQTGLLKLNKKQIEKTYFIVEYRFMREGK